MTALHLVGDSDSADVWRTLASTPDPPHLKDIATDCVTGDLLAYLDSYSGIETMKLVDIDAGSLERADPLADTFFNTVLPHHAQSLLALACTASHHSRWSFGAHSVESLLQLQKLRSLEVAVHPGHVEPPTSVLVRTKNPFEFEPAL
ncbi:hypothetical protein GGX14DRAFT_376539 [Mycena pura]|uniref:Uncharacterized protein n=1 Tax=Mycena pura TaxID=153505 RepID=A0AAD6V2V7_9AGAR|nr:hypothetical protein GGX14DRAFT_376539 [Mycena pura]